MNESATCPRVVWEGTYGTEYINVPVRIVEIGPHRFVVESRQYVGDELCSDAMGVPLWVECENPIVQRFAGEVITLNRRLPQLLAPLPADGSG